jgi:mRNA interferase RelE/StbE
LKVEFKSSFARDLRKLRNEGVQARIQQLIELVERSPSLDAVPGVRRLQASGEYYRIRVGDYRVGIAIVDGGVVFVRCLHRRDIYRYFP